MCLEGTLVRRAKFNDHRPTSNRLGACVCVGFSDLAQHNGIWALILVPKRASKDSKRGQCCHYLPRGPR